MISSKRVTVGHLLRLAKLQRSNRPIQDLDVDDVMVLGGNRLIAYDRAGGLTLTRRGVELLATLPQP